MVVARLPARLQGSLTDFVGDYLENDIVGLLYQLRLLVLRSDEGDHLRHGFAQKQFERYCEVEAIVFGCDRKLRRGSSKSLSTSPSGFAGRSCVLAV